MLLAVQGPQAWQFPRSNSCRAKVFPPSLFLILPFKRGDMAAHVLPQKLAGRYDVKDVLGQGGMGLVYRAYDTLIRRDVALKTLRDAPDPNSLQLFYKESDVLASMSHPNIVEIFDIGEFEENGQKKPYFVMPLLTGLTLDNLIRDQIVQRQARQQ